MKKRFSLLTGVIALSAIALMGCSNGYRTVTTAVSGKDYTGCHSGSIYLFSFSSDTNTVSVTKDSSISTGSYSLLSTTLRVATADVSMIMEYDPGNDCLIYEKDTFSKR